MLQILGVSSEAASGPAAAARCGPRRPMPSSLSTISLVLEVSSHVLLLLGSLYLPVMFPYFILFHPLIVGVVGPVLGGGAVAESERGRDAATTVSGHAALRQLPLQPRRSPSRAQGTCSSVFSLPAQILVFSLPADSPLFSYPKQQEALGRRSVGGSVAALLKPLFIDLEPASRQLTAISRATLAQLDTVPGVGEKVRSTLRLLGFVEEEQGAGEEEGEGSAGRK